MQHLTTRALRVSTDGYQAVNLDGEVVATSPVLFEVERNVVDVLVPQHVTHLRRDLPASARR